MVTQLAYYTGLTGTSSQTLPAGWIEVDIRVVTVSPQAVQTSGNPPIWHGLGRWGLQWAGGVSENRTWTLTSGPIRFRNTGLLPTSVLPTSLALNLEVGTIVNVEVLGP